MKNPVEFQEKLITLLQLLKEKNLTPSIITPIYGEGTPDEGTLLEFYGDIEACIHFQESGLIMITKRQNGISHICETTWEEIEKVPAFLLRNYSNNNHE